jgi:Flp pilus assembly protein CpaB
MRPRTFILLILVLLVLVVAAGAAYLVLTGGGPFANLLGLGGNGDDGQPPVTNGQAQDGGVVPVPTSTPAVQFVPVVVAVTDLPIGARITPDLVRVERRPDTNVAVVAGVTFDDTELVVGQIVKTNISRGQEIIRPMLALNPTDLVTLGSDLALYVDQGRVSIAVPIDRYSGAAFAMRPGDLVDVLMSLKLVELDPDFQTARPNVWIRVFEPGLLQGGEFLFGQTSEGRLEFIPELGTPGVVGPRLDETQIPRRVTQLTIQQAEVLWMGSWLDPVNGLEQVFPADAVLTVDETQPQDPDAPPPQPTPRPPQIIPDIVLLSMTVQDALALKFSLETGVEIHLALRSQGDNSVFITTSVSLPQIVDQGILTIPEPSEFGLEPRVDLVPTPGVPDIPEGSQFQQAPTGAES